MEAPCWKNSNVWYTVWTKQEDNTALKSHMFTSASKLWQMSSRTISESFLLIYFLVSVFANMWGYIQKKLFSHIQLWKT
jgi:hypothetical protein